MSSQEDSAALVDGGLNRGNVDLGVACPHHDSPGWDAKPIASPNWSAGSGDSDQNQPGNDSHVGMMGPRGAQYQ